MGVFVAQSADKKIVLIAGRPSHGTGVHEFRAGSLLLEKCLDKLPGITAEVHDMGWLTSDAVFKGADAFLVYADGGGRHLAMRPERVQLINELIAKGAGVGCAHYGVEVPAGDTGKIMQDWIGGYYEHKFSVSPMWAPDFQKLPNHPIAKVVLNGLLWLAKAKVSKNGVVSSVSPEQLEVNLDPKGHKKRNNLNRL